MVEVTINSAPIAKTIYSSSIPEEYYLDDKHFLVLHMKNNNDTYDHTNTLNTNNIK